MIQSACSYFWSVAAGIPSKAELDAGLQLRWGGGHVGMYRIFLGIVWAVGVLAFASSPSDAAPPRRVPHLRLREWHSFSNVAWQYDRWFVPGEIGREAAGAPWSGASETLGPDEQNLSSILGAGESTEAGKGSWHDGEGNRPSVTSRAFLTRALGGRIAPDWAAFNGIGPRLNFSHNLSRVFPSELFGAHPEYFPMVGGERVEPKKGRVNWNPDLGEVGVADHAAQAAADFFASNPNEVSFALGINDGLRFGESPATLRWVAPTRWFRNRPDYSDLVFQFMNGVAERLEGSWPHKYVGALAYYWAENEPSFPLHPQVLPYLTADRSQFYDREFRGQEFELQEKWGEGFGKPEGGGLQPETGDWEEGRRKREQSDQVDTGISRASGSRSQRPVAGHQQPATSPQPRLGIYDYIYGTGFLIPRIHTQALAEHLRHARRVGFTDYYAEVYPNWGLDGPQPWFVAQLLMDPEQSADRLLDEYYKRYFRESARAMRRFFEACESIWMHQPGDSYWLKHFRNSSQVDLFPPAICVRLRSYLNEAYEKSAGDPVVQARVEMVSDAFGVTERFSRLNVARNALQRSLLVEIGGGGRSGATQSDVTREQTNRVSRADAIEGNVMMNFALEKEIQQQLTEYVNARMDFVDYVGILQERHPLALSKWDVADFLRHDPGPTAEAWLEIRGDLTSSRRSFGGSLQAERWVGPPEIAERIAGLPYSVGLPKPWRSSVEPRENLVAELKTSSGTSVDSSLSEVELAVLRLENNKLTSISQVVPVLQHHRESVHSRAWLSVEVKGRVGVSSFLCLTASWYDEGPNQVGGLTEVKLPEGSWPDWVTLRLAAHPPQDARYLNYLIWSAHQQTGDWLELRNPRLEWDEAVESLSN